MAYSSTPTDRLARETKARAHDVYAINTAAFEAAGPALFSFIPFAMAGSWLFVSYIDDSRATALEWLAVIVSIGIAAPFWMRWAATLRACGQFTREMIARRKELEARNNS